MNIKLPELFLMDKPYYRCNFYISAAINLLRLSTDFVFKLRTFQFGFRCLQSRFHLLFNITIAFQLFSGEIFIRKQDTNSLSVSYESTNCYRLTHLLDEDLHFDLAYHQHPVTSSYMSFFLVRFVPDF
ncbi:hypothetical protein NPIL_187881 [Nephila pilipes]|uniref:Uncharacterized protein n=1 Tax=Nephila pilipes TaxID=299642 RepID=A0A8X6TAV0_NEPPI|nr:hypothetical protein NPIL_187881 [Nephila pilipes]